MPRTLLGFVRRSTGSAVALFLAFTIGAAQESEAPRPNIVFILADDLGWGDVGYHGSDIETPNIDKLAASGVRLNQFYVLQLCTPTRAALLTGRYPMRFGMQRGHVSANFPGGMPPAERTLAQALRECGYWTGIFGKWHLGHAAKEYRPLARGFDLQYGSYASAVDYYSRRINSKNNQEPGWFRHEEPLVEEGYTTDLITDEVIRVLENHEGEQPLFLYVPYTAPHVPIQAPPEYVDRHPDIERLGRRRYAGMVSALDDGVGRIVRAIDELGIGENTLIVFCSDNGAIHGGSNAPLRGGKAQLYEGGVRVPAIVAWPGVLEPGAVLDDPLHVVDFYPTLVRLAGGSLDQPLALDGEDMWPTLTAGAPSPHDDILVNTTETASALRRGPWKLVVKHRESDVAELYDLAGDPNEEHDVAAAHPEIVVELSARLAAYRSASVESIYTRR